jgi:hypothetical protein
VVLCKYSSLAYRRSITQKTYRFIEDLFQYLVAIINRCVDSAKFLVEFILSTSPDFFALFFVEVSQDGIAR